ncbi:MAG TPA: hypothetical protein VFB79_02345 [Candidatus Angelobacter sp.]|nr:hypothetical protein [Candidatus Angelobacter sp.]
MIQIEKAGAGIARHGVSSRALPLALNECAPIATQSQSMADINRAAETPRSAPWEVCPQQLVSWWDMQDFSAAAFYWAGQVLENLKVDCLLKPGAGDQNFDIGILYQPIKHETLAKAIDTLEKIERECERIGLRVSAETIRHDILKPLRDDKDSSYHWLIGQINNVQRLIQREMKNRLFFFVSPDKAKFWPTMNQPHAFGEQVYKAFPSTQWDILQASFTLAAGFGTASVFHLMRVLEIVLGALGNKFGVSLAHTNWAPAIEQIESRIREMHKDPAWKVMPDCKEQQAFYSQAASYFGVVKDAWRNHTMHVRGKYTEQEAEHIYNAIKAITQKLAERLSE